MSRGRGLGGASAKRKAVHSLEKRLQRTLPRARLEEHEVAGVRLYLLQSDFPPGPLSAEEHAAVWAEPAFWCFCWPGGMSLAKRIRHRPDLQGMRIVDFGCGSGVVGIACALRGAEVFFCDRDEDARAAARANCELNSVQAHFVEDWDSLPGVDGVMAADVFYEPENHVWLERFLAKAPHVLLADCRPAPFYPRAYQKIANETGSVVPDLDHGDEFRHVQIYGTGKFGQTIKT